MKRYRLTLERVRPDYCGEAVWKPILEESETGSVVKVEDWQDDRAKEFRLWSQDGRELLRDRDAERARADKAETEIDSLRLQLKAAQSKGEMSFLKGVELSNSDRRRLTEERDILRGKLDEAVHVSELKDAELSRMRRELDVLRETLRRTHHVHTITTDHGYDRDSPLCHSHTLNPADDSPHARAHRVAVRVGKLEREVEALKGRGT